MLCSARVLVRWRSGPALRNVETASGPGSTTQRLMALARPKSAILASARRRFVVVSRMFSGLKSLCTMAGLWACRYAMPWARPRNQRNTSALQVKNDAQTL